MNFTYLLGAPPDREWGVKKENGEWTGMIRQLQDQDIDIGTGASFHNLAGVN